MVPLWVGPRRRNRWISVKPPASANALPTVPPPVIAMHATRLRTGTSVQIIAELKFFVHGSQHMANVLEEVDLQKTLSAMASRHARFVKAAKVALVARGWSMQINRSQQRELHHRLLKAPTIQVQRNNMAKFAAALTEINTTAHILFSGILDETAILEKLDLKKFAAVEIDLKNIERVTSSGLRLWRMWISTLDQSKKYSIQNCCKTFVNQANLIARLIPKWMDVKSVELPYFCEKCSDLFAIVIQLNPSNSAPNDVDETAPCPKCGRAAELDVDPVKYFRFFGCR